MQRYTYWIGLFLFCAVSILSASVVLATDNITIDTSHSSEGYVSICCSLSDSPKIKIGVTLKDETIYYDYTVGETWNYAFERGDGDYTISVYGKVKGTWYQELLSKQVTVKLTNDLSPFLINTWEIDYTDKDVCQIADEVCDDLQSNSDKVLAITNYIDTNISYNYTFAANINNGVVKSYIPNAADTLHSGTGICYDYAVLFAAMCRSQGIPCVVEKDFYHAWNEVYLDNTWCAIDILNGIYATTT